MSSPTTSRPQPLSIPSRKRTPSISGSGFSWNSSAFGVTPTSPTATQLATSPLTSPGMLSKNASWSQSNIASSPKSRPQIPSQFRRFSFADAGPLTEGAEYSGITSTMNNEANLPFSPPTYPKRSMSMKVATQRNLMKSRDRPPSPMKSLILNGQMLD
ncbi:hypothetical protein K493DRAFT_87810 [Basidiobolus meristosporus CBS 931.73]|uniref:Uncharacterized protein n=1 Tax=Basidiobolus meristosporus CBS 931.73 TaxID=1314790 RepID=A0A1Y1YVF4_9FUNG|nr:hypothetical protein K493DRAFT_87810 [Basidiobolus meristosporus CBS 931.73]|eukprot:ORY02010.1 hypothetical protein K493DRAFT_87810 [Basidiobolus meristosporus CBS 931.73]